MKRLIFFQAKNKVIQITKHFAPGHAVIPHSLVSILSPTQSLPPLAGAGLVHVLDRDWLPPPHVTEQDPHGFQSDH